MSTLICGSLAYDTIMVFPDQFKNHILPDKVHILNVSFLVPRMRREFGGCAGNIAYTLRQLGGQPLIKAALGADGGPYLERLQGWGVNLRHVSVVQESYTAQAIIITDQDNNQITAFHPGAMQYAHQAPITPDFVLRLAHAVGRVLRRTVQPSARFWTSHAVDPGTAHAHWLVLVILELCCGRSTPPTRPRCSPSW